MSRSQQNADYLTQYNWLPYRNKLINGDFRIDQRLAGSSSTTTPYCGDRWESSPGATGTMTRQRVANGPYGNTYSAQITVTSVATRLATDYSYLSQKIEADNMVDLQWGYSTAKTCTLSFWVKNSLTGTYGGVIASGNNARSYCFTYTVNSASTWEYKTIVIPGDTTGGSTAYPQGSGIGLYVKFGFGCGSNYQMSAGSWQALSNYIDVTGSASFTQTAGAVVNISMVQFEAGSLATPFEVRPIGVELSLCQRYYQHYVGTSTNWTYYQAYGAASTQIMFTQTLPVTMRANPAPTIIGTWTYSNASTFNIFSNHPTTITPYFTITALGGTAAYAPANGGYSLSAEL